MSTAFLPGSFSGQQFEILGGGMRRGGWLDSWQNRLKMERWLEEQRQIAERATKRARRGESAPAAADIEGDLAEFLVPADLETTRYSRRRAAGLTGPLQYLLEPA